MQPLIETYGTERVPSELRTEGFTDIFLIMVNFFLNPATIMTAAMAVAGGLTVTTVIAVQLAGVLLSMLAFATLARIGVDYGLTGQMACRAALGVRGGRWFSSPLRAICSIYWFAFQTQVGTLALIAVLESKFQLSIPFVSAALLFASLQILVALLGYQSLQSLFRWSFPMKLLSIAALSAVLMIRVPDATAAVSYKLVFHDQWLLVMIWFNAIFGSMLTMITDAADFTRYISNRKSLWKGVMLGSFLGVLLGAGLGASAMAILGGEPDQLFHRLLSVDQSMVVIVALLVLMVLDNWTINVINLYSGGISLSHTFEKLGRFKCTLLVSALSIILSCFPAIIDRYLGIMESAGILFSGIGGILLADYMSRRYLLNIPALYAHKTLFDKAPNPYWYSAGLNLKALLLVVLTTALGFSLSKGWPVPLLVILVTAGLYRLFVFQPER